MLGLHDRMMMPLLDTGRSRDEAGTTTSDQADAVLRGKPSAKFSQLLNGNEQRDRHNRFTRIDLDRNECGFVYSPSHLYLTRSAS